MSLAPLLNASPAIQVHAFAALAAFALGAIQLSAPKGTLPHRTAGWIWALLMVIVAGSSFLIHCSPRRKLFSSNHGRQSWPASAQCDG